MAPFWGFSGKHSTNHTSECFHDWAHDNTQAPCWACGKKQNKSTKRHNTKGRTYNDYFWPLNYVPVLGELKTSVGVLIPCACNQRNPSCCWAQWSSSSLSNQSSECLCPASANTSCHNFSVLFVFILILNYLFAAMMLRLFPEWSVWKLFVSHSVAGLEDKPNLTQFSISSLLCSLTSKGPARSLSVFKTIGLDSEAGSSLIYPLSTYSLVQETKVNQDLPRIYQTHEDLVDS